MKKLVAAFAFVFALAAQTEAQQLKFGHVDSQSLLQDMDEVKQVNKTLEEQQSLVEKQLVVLQEDLTKMQNEAQKAAQANQLTEQQMVEKQAELEEMYQKIMTFRTNAVQELQMKQQELLAPIILKIRRLIDEVGEEGGFMYIFDGAQPQEQIRFIGAQSQDITPLVKAKLSTNK